MGQNGRNLRRPAGTQQITTRGVPRIALDRSRSCVPRRVRNQGIRIASDQLSSPSRSDQAPRLTFTQFPSRSIPEPRQTGPWLHTSLMAHGYRIWLTTRSVNGKAAREAVRLLSGKLGVPWMTAVFGQEPRLETRQGDSRGVESDRDSHPALTPGRGQLHCHQEGHDRANLSIAVNGLPAVGHRRTPSAGTDAPQFVGLHRPQNGG